MKHYHGTPLGGKRDEIVRFARNRYFLIPYLRPEDLPVIADVATGFCFDNSAFTAWKKGTPIADWEPYYEWCKEWSRHPSFDWAIIPDVVDGPESDNDELLLDWDAKMRHPIYVKGVPVWHMHESLDRLHRLCTGQWSTVAIGSSGKWPTPGTNGWWTRMNEAMETATDEHGRPLRKLHGLRMLDPGIFEKIPFSSADSTNVAQNSNLLSRFGMYKPPTQSQRREVIASRIEACSSPAVWALREEEPFTLF